jgi:hypothetical protein
MGPERRSGSAFCVVLANAVELVPARVAKTANAATKRAARKQEEIVVKGAFLWEVRWRFVIGFGLELGPECSSAQAQTACGQVSGARNDRECANRCNRGEPHTHLWTTKYLLQTWLTTPEFTAQLRDEARRNRAFGRSVGA